ncbi:MAG: hypothetical protein ACJ0Q8_05460 [Candidatus Azotimanducaceae bacterium]
MLTTVEDRNSVRTLIFNRPDVLNAFNDAIRDEVPAGSALVYLGSTMHGGGANTPSNERRRGMLLGFVVGWLRTEENTFLNVPLDKARTTPARVQQLLGYKAHGSIGVVDVGDPMVLLQ